MGEGLGSARLGVRKGLGSAWLGWPVAGLRRYFLREFDAGRDWA